MTYIIRLVPTFSFEDSDKAEVATPWQLSEASQGETAILSL